RRTTDALRRVLRPGLRVRSNGRFPGLARRTRGARPRRAVHGGERPGRLQAHVRADARRADLVVRVGHRIVVPAAGGDVEPLLPPFTGVAGITTGPFVRAAVW